MTTKKVSAQEIDPNAYYRVKVARRFEFEGADFSPLSEMEIDGAMLARVLADEMSKKHIAGYDKKD